MEEEGLDGEASANVDDEGPMLDGEASLDDSPSSRDDVAESSTASPNFDVESSASAPDDDEASRGRRGASSDRSNDCVPSSDYAARRKRLSR